MLFFFCRYKSVVKPSTLSGGARAVNENDVKINSCVAHHQGGKRSQPDYYFNTIFRIECARARMLYIYLLEHHKYFCSKLIRVLYIKVRVIFKILFLLYRKIHGPA